MKCSECGQKTNGEGGKCEHCGEGLEQEKCKDVVREHYKSRMKQITKLWNLYKEDPEGSDEEYGRWREYGLAFDYVPKGTFTDQKRGYFRYQISYGGPSEEFRIYTDETLRVDYIDFWYLDWFDGAKARVTGEALKVWLEIWDDFMDMELPQRKMRDEIEQ